ncbi:MAG: Tfp pilus assembly protein, ATPase PilM [uncultured bacterium]|nr:MAG: Tfp pilus assembly protein, ATPase PilM [uncultured bacterium]
MSFLNKKIFNDSFDIFGLDLSDLSVKVVNLQNNGTCEYVSSFSTVAIPGGCIREGEILQKDQVVSAIKKAIEIAGPKKMKTKKVICSLPETKAFLRIISVPQMGESELNEAVKWEMEANIPLPLDQVYYDWQAIPEFLILEKNKINLIVVAIAKNVVDQAIDVLEAAGLVPIGLEIESIAQARSLLLDKNEKNTVLIVDIGDRRTSFSIAKGGVPCFTSSIPLCGQSFTEVISNGMGISFEQAEKMKIIHGIGDDFKNDALFKFTKPILENFVQEIERSIDFYLTGLKYSDSVDKIIICGGGANTKGIVPYLSKKIGREIEIGNPWVNMQLGKKLPIIDKKQSLQYSTAIGLALKGLHYEDLS